MSSAPQRGREKSAKRSDTEFSHEKERCLWQREGGSAAGRRIKRQIRSKIGGPRFELARQSALLGEKKM